jgi:putative flippase GtrA
MTLNLWREARARQSEQSQTEPWCDERPSPSTPGHRPAAAASLVGPARRRLSRERLAPVDLIRWIKFNFVGSIGIGVQLAALVFFRSGLHLDTLLATALAVETSVVHNYLWHERFTWRDRRSPGSPQSLARFARFNLTNGAVSLSGNLLIMRSLVGEFHVNYLVANLIAVTVCSLANFLLSDRLVFVASATDRTVDRCIG